ncbi:MAG TPA: DUF1304 domain-containing protein [Pseudolysinimonas sp.]|nr:DUF1304 domain-containing protein [Pseudolysinimonas sp.]
MSTALLVVGIVAAAVAALIHVLIFFMESVLWSRPGVWRGFGVTTQADADVLRPMAFNQGFYNVFLAIGTAVGLLMLTYPSVATAGLGVVLFALLSMLLASIVLITSNPKLLRAALIQGLAPLIAIGFLILAQVV